MWAAPAVEMVVVMPANNARRLPWINKMRRLHSGSLRADWMAPDHVVQKVEKDYLAAVEWMQDSPILSWAQQWRIAVEMLAGPYLRRYQHLLLLQRSERPTPVYGVLRADHTLEVRGFSEDGRRCWLIDHQFDRRMATYDAQTHERIVTQDLGDSALVICLLYDLADDRWKPEALIQELPSGWKNRRAKLALVPELTTSVRRIGRDA